MATYKVLQDIEAEDKLIGPLTLKQCLFAGAVCVLLFIEFKIVTTGALGVVRWPLITIFVLPIIVFGFLAAPIGRDQPNDIWLLARLRFFIKPHRRVWDQNGMSNLVTVTAPVHVEMQLTNGLSQDEVHSRLQALADTLDSRGWAVKNVSVNMYAEPGYLSPSEETDRLVAVSSLPQDVPSANITAADDIMDTTSNPLAHQLNDMITASSQAHLQNVALRMQEAQSTNGQRGAGQGQPAPDYWFMHQQDGTGNGGGHSGGNGASAPPQDYSVFSSQVVAPGADDSATLPKPTADEEALLQRVRTDQGQTSAWKAHMHTIQPIANPQGSQGAQGDDVAAGPVAGSQAERGQAMSGSYQARGTAGTNASNGRPVNEAEIPKVFGRGVENDIPAEAAARLFGSSLPADHQVSVEPMPQSRPPQLVNSFPSAASPGNTGQAGQKSDTNAPNPAILQLAHNDDLNVATIARQANAIAHGGDDEVVISLH